MSRDTERSRAWGRGGSLLAVVLVVACGASATPPSEALGTTQQALRASNYFGASLPSKTLALTFDDGPGPRTAELSTYLRARGIRAAFFVNGGRLAPTTLPNPGGLGPVPTPTQLLAQLAGDGHLVANHTTTHRDLVTHVRAQGAAQLTQELAETDQIIGPYIPSGHLLFRPPYGSWSAAVAQDLAASPMKKYLGPVNWDVGGVSTEYPARAADWACFGGDLRTAHGALANGTGFATSKQCGDAYLNEIRSIGRGIVLMHDPYGWSGGDTVDMVMYLVPLLLAEGYAFARVDDVPALKAELPPIPCDPTCSACFGTPKDQCTSCAPGHVLKDTSCLACAQCPKGTYAAAACAGTNDTWCVACDKSCSSCKGKGPAGCSSCAAGAFLKGGRCLPCRRCADTETVRAACTATTDTVCDACADAQEPSLPASACFTCGDCDDADPCTQDACGAEGCTHERIEGCASAPDGGPEASPLPPPAASGCSYGPRRPVGGLDVATALAGLSLLRRRWRRRARSAATRSS